MTCTPLPQGSFHGLVAIDQDVETVDPVLNPLLNRELQRTGGRTLIRLGSEDIDYSPDFLLLLVTRNPGARFTPDLCSRVTIVNFTVTPASLQSQVRFDGSGKPPRTTFGVTAEETFCVFVTGLYRGSLLYRRYLSGGISLLSLETVGKTPLVVT